MNHRRLNFFCSLQKLVHGFAPWGIFLTMLGLLITLFGLVIELEDRQSERIFRAWATVTEVERQSRSRPYEEVGLKWLSGSGSAAYQAIVFLNRDFNGRFCGLWLVPIFEFLTGNHTRTCFIPKKRKGSFANRDFRGANFEFISLTSAVLVNVNFENANLENANLENAILVGANLADAILADANLEYAILEGANLEGANLENANL